MPDIVFTPLVITFALLALVCILAMFSGIREEFRARGQSVEILSQAHWYFYYWPANKKIRVSVPLDIDSPAKKANLKCTVQVGQVIRELKLSPRNLTASPFVQHRFVPEFEASDFNISEDIKEAIVSFSIRLANGVSKNQTETISIQRVGQ